MEKAKINSACLNFVKKAIEAALEYEIFYAGKRKLGITGEIGEILACNKLNLDLVLSTIHQGFDAIDEKGKRVQIKSCRSETQEISPNKAKIGRFSKHEFDYAILVLLGRQYEIKELWKASYDQLESLISKYERRNPSIGQFKKIGQLYGEQFAKWTKPRTKLDK